MHVLILAMFVKRAAGGRSQHIITHHLLGASSCEVLVVGIIERRGTTPSIPAETGRARLLERGCSMFFLDQMDS